MLSSKDVKLKVKSYFLAPLETRCERHFADNFKIEHAQWQLHFIMHSTSCFSNIKLIIIRHNSDTFSPSQSISCLLLTFQPLSTHRIYSRRAFPLALELSANFNIFFQKPRSRELQRLVKCVSVLCSLFLKSRD